MRKLQRHAIAASEMQDLPTGGPWLRTSAGNTPLHGARAAYRSDQLSSGIWLAFIYTESNQIDYGKKEM
jgi:hypothetical protein